MKKLAVVVVHCLEILALAAWVGGLIGIMAAVIPAVFNIASMQVGGRMLTRTFENYDLLVLISAAVLILGLLVRSRLYIDTGAEIGMGEPFLLAIMVSIAVFLTFYLNPEIERLQAAAFAAHEEAVKRSAYDAFFRYHWSARGLYLLNFGLGIALMCVKVRKWSR